MSNVWTEVRQGEGDYPALRLRLRKAGVVPGGLSRAANMGLQVARTYTSRWRFRLFGLFYVLNSWGWAQVANPLPGWQLATTVFLDAFLGCFVALHLRRQFSTPAAKVVPHFAAAHLAVGAVVSLLLWVGVPAVQAYFLKLPAWGPIGVHALAGLFLAISICWRQAIVLLLGMPVFVLLGMNVPGVMAAKHPLGSFLLGGRPELSTLAIVAAIAAHVVAAKVLLGLSDRNVAVSDDFTVDTPSSERVGGRLDERMLAYRDRSIQRQLADAGFGWWFVKRWRVPGTASWQQLALAAGAGAVLVAACRWGSGHLGGVILGLIVSIFAMLVAPFNNWHLRRGMIGMEMMRPVTRRQYVYQVALATAWDVATWTALASVFSVAVFAATFPWHPSVLPVQAMYLLLLWSAAVFAYGVGLATFRSRYWLPLMAAIALGWSLVVAYSAALLIVQLKLSGARPSQLQATCFPLAWIFAGLLLAALTIRRWLRSDVV